MQGKRVLITAGPTYEKIDPVRFIGNYSSGKMGFSLANECAKRGALVTLIAGPVHLKADHPNIHRIDVESAREMYDAVLQSFSNQDAAILCAAVADYRPEEVAVHKIKRTGDDLIIRLVPNPDIAASIGKMTTPNQTLVGFALETNDAREHALLKMKKKNLDFIVLNSLEDAGAGFQVDTNKITLLFRSGEEKAYPLKLKSELAKDIIDELQSIIHNKSI